mgnify:FL=1
MLSLLSVVCLSSIITISCGNQRDDHSLSNLTVINVKIGDATIEAEVAFTPEERSKGLSGRKHLPDGRGMLFYYSDSTPKSFWMKEMLFDIDILWIGEDCTVIKIDNELPSPSSTTAELKIYPAPKLSRSVLELSAGQAELLGLKIGDKVAYQTSTINKHSGCTE